MWRAILVSVSIDHVAPKSRSQRRDATCRFPPFFKSSVSVLAAVGSMNERTVSWWDGSFTARLRFVQLDRRGCNGGPNASSDWRRIRVGESTVWEKQVHCSLNVFRSSCEPYAIDAEMPRSVALSHSRTFPILIAIVSPTFFWINCDRCQAPKLETPQQETTNWS
jgi:hypothetical protein